MKRALTFSLGAGALLLASHPTTAQACAMCYGGVDQNTGQALNGAIFVMLGCVGGMLGLIVAVGIGIVRRSRRAAQEPLFPE